MASSKDSAEFLQPEQLSRISDYALLAKIAVQGFLPGLHRSAYAGSGCEFRQYRNYSPGDDIRNVDWKAYAKHNRFYTKVYEDETNANCLVLLDTSGSMGYQGSRSPCSKLHYAATAASIICYLALRQSDRAGLIAYNDQIELDIPPGNGSMHLPRIAANLQRLEARGKSDHTKALQYAAQKAGRRSLVILCSDLVEAENEIRPLLKRLRAAQNDCILLHTLDDDEIDFPFEQTTRFYDSEETGSVITAPPRVREHYQEQMQTFLDRVQEVCRESEVDYLRMTASQDITRLLSAYLHTRRRFY